MILRKSDWHPADIIAALRKRGTTLAAISRNAGLSSSTLANALSRPWPKGEWIIANFLGIHPSEIWPSRYFNPITGELLERKVREKTQTISWMQIKKLHLN
nr:helix-turn-helix transcriptional regulator [Providencia burhodogranariea]